MSSSSLKPPAVEPAPTPLSPERLAEIAARAKAAAPGPWETDTAQGAGTGVAGQDRDLWIVPLDDLDPADAEFIAAARTDVPALLAEVERLSADLAEVEMLTGQQCENGKHADWAVDSEHNHLCPWCRIAELQVALDDVSKLTSTWFHRAEAAEARVAELETALVATGKSLSTFIFDSEDPGSDAFGAQWLYQQAMPQADDPWMKPNAFKAAAIDEAADRLEKANPDRGADFSEGVDWAVGELRDMAEQTVSAKAGDRR